MERPQITPIRAEVAGAVIFLTDRDGDVQPVTMPNTSGAVFCALALNLEFNRARRAGE